MNKVANALQWLCVAGAAWYIVVFTYVACASMAYPFNLEWMEGQSIDVIQRIMEGKPFYTKPSIEYVTYIYTPLYFYVAALFSEVMGLGFFPARLVSTLSALGVGIMIYAWVRKNSQTMQMQDNWKAGVIGAGLFFATYRLSGRWFDNSRADSLCLFLTFLSMFIYTYYTGWKSAALAAAVGAAAFFTKQSALGLIVPVMLAGLLLERKRAMLSLGMLAVLVVGGIVAYDIASDGWFSFFVFKVPAGHSLDGSAIWGFWEKDMFRHLGTAILVMAVVTGLFWLQDWKIGLRYTALVAGALATTYVARLHGFGYINVLMPAHAMLGLMAGLAFAYACHKGSDEAVIVVALALLWQMHTLYFNPSPLIPGELSVIQGNRFLQELANVEGDVFIPELQYVQTRVGKKSYTLGMAAFDLVRSNLKDQNNVKKEFMDELTKAIASGRFSAIMPGRLVPVPDYQRYYVQHGRLRYPKEYVTGAIGFLQTDLFLRIIQKSNENSRIDEGRRIGY